ncbi:30S ribosomal protein S10 [Candidatus Lariskella endosymbiont of Epinotia ramella]|uniref:30S ribosomal protein S10 n=1 Tax=Candidatus Lariskella endosymbiont of Epinotia ramella TaxID=3066224 RepID=UPI0030CEFDDC
MAIKQEIKLKLKAFDHRLLDHAVADIVYNLRLIGAKISGPVPLPNDIFKITVNRSTHVDKKSREQFEMREHSRLLLIESSPQTIDVLMKLDLPSGVDAEVNY